MKTITLALISLFAAPIWSATVVDNCPCGYTTEDGGIWTELLETDFTTVKDLFYQDHGWQVQEYNTSASPQDGVLARYASRYNLVYGTGGLQLMVHPPDSNNSIGGSEISTSRSDMLYGSFRVALKSTTVNGTCGAFFWFKDDSSEIDIELLSREYYGSSSLGNFVIHSSESAADNFNAALTPTFDNQPLGFDPSTGFHEYRFDWYPNAITFFLDGVPIKNMTLNVPNGPGTIFLNHWSNGSPEWTYGPPAQDAAMTILYMKAYFNSSTLDSQKTAANRCNAATTTNKGKTCPIPGLIKSTATTTIGPPPSYTSGLPQSQATQSATYTVPAGTTNLPTPGQVPFLSGNASNVVSENLYNNTYTGPGATSGATWSRTTTEAKLSLFLSVMIGFGMIFFL